MRIGKRPLAGTKYAQLLLTRGWSDQLGCSQFNTDMSAQVQESITRLRQQLCARADSVWIPLRRQLHGAD